MPPEDVFTDSQVLETNFLRHYFSALLPFRDKSQVVVPCSGMENFNSCVLY